MSSTGIDRRTGRALAGWPHVVQSIRVILSTSIGSRIMRRSFGSAIPSLLGRENMERGAVLRFATAMAIAIALWEPRYRLRTVYFSAQRNSASGLQQGRIEMTMTGDYMPRALAGDFTVERVREVKV